MKYFVELITIGCLLMIIYRSHLEFSFVFFRLPC